MMRHELEKSRCLALATLSVAALPLRDGDVLLCLAAPRTGFFPFAGTLFLQFYTMRFSALHDFLSCPLCLKRHLVADAAKLEDPARHAASCLDGFCLPWAGASCLRRFSSSSLSLRKNLLGRALSDYSGHPHFPIPFRPVSARTATLGAANSIAPADRGLSSSAASCVRALQSPKTELRPLGCSAFSDRQEASHA